jgi:hypothetical protein
MTEIPWPALVAGACLLLGAIIGGWLWITRDRGQAVSKAATDAANALLDAEKRRAEAEHAAAVAAGQKAVAEADAAAEKRMASATSLADIMRDLDAESND